MYSESVCIIYLHVCVCVLIYHAGQSVPEASVCFLQLQTFPMIHHGLSCRFC